jgi:hypothetical protein
MNTGKKDLLKEAIADAKAVKETALANAKIALEEAFTPRLQSMLSHKLAEELEDDETLPVEEDEMMGDEEFTSEDEMMGDEEFTTEEDEMMGDEFTTEEDEFGAEEFTTEEDEMMGDEFTTEGEEFESDDEDEMAGDVSDLDLDEIIRELEGEMGDEEFTTEEDEMMGDEFTTEDDDEAAAEITELRKMRERIGRRLSELESSEIGAGDNKVADYTSDTEYSEAGDFIAEDDEELDLNEVIRALREMNADEPSMEEDDDIEIGGMTEEEAEELQSQNLELQSDLQEAYKVIKSLKGTINEVNLLNAKLLYTNKLFRNFDLNENQKVKVVENFDRASSLREVKLVFATLGENLNVARKTQKRVVKESFASNPIKGTKPATTGIITEGSSLAARFQKLANIKK